MAGDDGFEPPRMPESKSGALPLGESPIYHELNGAVEAYRRITLVYRLLLSLR